MLKNMSSLLRFTFLCSILLSSSVYAQVTPKPEPPKETPAASSPEVPPVVEEDDSLVPYIVSIPNLKLRASSNGRSAEVANLSMGTVVGLMQLAKEKSVVNGIESYWCKVIDEANKKTGWVFGGFLQEYADSTRIQTYLNIMKPLMRADPTSYNDEIDKYNFLTRAVTEAQDRAQIAELTLASLVTVKRILTLIYKDPAGINGYKLWLNNHQNELTFHQATGKYYFNPEILWELQSEFHDVDFADRIAFEAARTDLVGSCGGNVACEFERLNKREGRYLSLYPDGAYRERVLDTFIAQMDTILAKSNFYLLPRNATSTFTAALADLNATLIGVDHPKQATASAKVSQVVRRYLRN